MRACTASTLVEKSQQPEIQMGWGRSQERMNRALESMQSRRARRLGGLNSENDCDQLFSEPLLILHRGHCGKTCRRHSQKQNRRVNWCSGRKGTAETGETRLGQSWNHLKKNTWPSLADFPQDTVHRSLGLTKSLRTVLALYHNDLTFLYVSSLLNWLVCFCFLRLGFTLQCWLT